MIFICPKCRMPKEQAEFPQGGDIRDAIANGQAMPRVACRECLAIMDKPCSPEFRQLLHAAWLRGENVN